MNVHNKRIRPLNKAAWSLWISEPKDPYKYKLKEPVCGAVAYWMSRDQRVKDNWAFIFAQDLAVESKTPLQSVFYLSESFLGATERQYDFMFKGLEQVEEDLKKLKIPLNILTGDIVEEFKGYCKKHSISAIVTDFSPLRVNRQWKELLSRELDIPIFEVDTHNIVPVWEASSKLEFAAYTIRPKIQKKLDEYLTDIPKLKSQNENLFQRIKNIEAINWTQLKKKIKVRQDVASVDWIKSGEKEAGKILREFIQHKLERYSELRNDPLSLVSSNLSPYLHFGQISPQRVAYEIKNASSTNAKLKSGADDFLEELIIRRELSDNFCLYNKSYDSVEGFPVWAKKTLEAHKKDKREYVYTKDQFERGMTHDLLWNAAQFELTKTGKMHGYMRMYWAKKIFEWTKDVEEAMDIAIYLNDTYELDGRDPNGYVGIAWCMGGVHDRAWFQRPIFGQIRYMARSGCDKKFNTKEYIKKFTPEA